MTASERSRAWYEANREAVKAKSRARYWGVVRAAKGRGAVKACERCAAEFVQTRIDRRFCSQRCQLSVAKKKNREPDRAYGRRRRARIAGLPSEKYTTFQVAEASAWACQHCARNIAMSELGPIGVVDHVIPISRGGSDVLANTQLLCRACNTRKGNRLESELVRAA